jgi:hypothetical protein
VKAWEIIRDVVLTGTGIWLAIHEAYSPSPDDAILALAMGFTAPAAFEHVKALLSSPGESGSSRRPPASGSPPSSPPPEGSGDHHATAGQ